MKGAKRVALTWVLVLALAATGRASSLGTTCVYARCEDCEPSNVQCGSQEFSTTHDHAGNLAEKLHFVDLRLWDKLRREDSSLSRLVEPPCGRLHGTGSRGTDDPGVIVIGMLETELKLVTGKKTQSVKNVLVVESLPDHPFHSGTRTLQDFQEFLLNSSVC